jgi:hypothetical protein
MEDSESLVALQSLQKILGEERYQKLLDDIEEHKEELLFQSEMIQASIKDKNVYHENLLKDVQKMIVMEELGELKSRIANAEQTGETVTELMKTFQEKRRLLESLE